MSHAGFDRRVLRRNRHPPLPTRCTDGPFDATPRQLDDVTAELALFFSVNTEQGDTRRVSLPPLASHNSGRIFGSSRSSTTCCTIFFPTSAYL